MQEKDPAGNHFYNPKQKKMKEFRVELARELNSNYPSIYKKLKELIEYSDDAVYTLEISAIFYIPTQKASSIKEKILKEAGLIRPYGRPDVDNFSKFLLDASHDVLYNDDSRVVKMSGEKRYSINPRIELFIKLKYNTEII